MTRNVFTLLFFLVCSCQSLPTIYPFGTPMDAHDKLQCTEPFLMGKWQFIHSIEAAMPTQKKAVVMGITNISGNKRQIEVVMMTIEGLVLFDAEYSDAIKINKGISPFDSVKFAKGLMDDIRLIFFTPEGELIDTGYSSDHSLICRYQNKNGFVIDIKHPADNVYEINKYNTYNKLIRTVRVNYACGNKGAENTAVPQKITLVGYGRQRYVLQMDLIKAKHILK